MGLEFLINCITENSKIISSKLKEGSSPAPLELQRSARLPVLAALLKEFDRPVVLLTDRMDHALTLVEEMGLLAPNLNLKLFPEPEPLFFEDAPWSDTTRLDRLLAITELASYHQDGLEVVKKPPLIIAPARAIMVRTVPKDEFIKNSRFLEAKHEIIFDEFITGCIYLGYENVTTVVAPNQIARRGGILDIWPPAETLPVRLEFFGNEIETLRRFDPGTQRSLQQNNKKNQDHVQVTPAREYICSSKNSPTHGIAKCSEFYIPLLHKNTASLLDYLPENGLIVIYDRQTLEDTVYDIEEQALGLRQEYIQNDNLNQDYPIPYITWAEIQESIETRQLLDLGPQTTVNYSDGTQKELNLIQSDTRLSDRFSPGPRFGGRLKQVMEHLSRGSRAGDNQVIVSRHSARLKGLWDEGHSLSKNDKPLFIEGSLTEGWVFLPEKCPTVSLLTDGEIFGWKRPEHRQRARPIAEAPEESYADLQTGDWVVHIDHGIGQYQGLVERNVDGLQREYLCIEYEGEAQLYVPVYQADRLTRYIGPDNRQPPKNRLGGAEWGNTKSSVKKAVLKVADDLLLLYAQRSEVEGFAFSPDSAWQHELEASFPYIETEDQVQVLSEVKLDMQTPRPMDRLICGDVGYGKTEVALRAAFKAVLDGKQVALLVPTTVLAQQHFHTFNQRLATFPVEVEMLSRFRTPQQQKEIINRLKAGNIDIIIGTHRLFSQDVEFKDLGLLIIDEEQRFGVTHKETLKKMRTEVDVLTMTATPIPRTLYMALSGIRDISTINTPPEERLPVITHVGPYSIRLVRQAVLRELERGGQVFFVHNRVHTIDAMANHLNHSIPEARIGIAHGQMHESELSKRMEQFTAGEIDVLLSTSIIESGLDIPNANTLIVDRADTFGLSQLYQLRGRVGRGAQRAFAYFFRHRRKLPTLEGRQRLETIAENTQLGAGFSIAMRDLEIRGAGDILGTRQHGHIAAVGFHLYTRLLGEAVRKIRNGKDLPSIFQDTFYTTRLFSSNVDLPLPMNIPAEYVPDKSIRLGLYRRLAGVISFDEVNAMLEEFTDRFGPPPETVRNLFFQLEVKLYCEQIGLSTLTTENSQIVMRYPDEEIPQNLPDLGTRVRIGKTALWMPLNGSTDWRGDLMMVLRIISSEQFVTQNSTIINK